MDRRGKNWSERKNKLRAETLLVHSAERLAVLPVRPSTVPIQMATAFEAPGADQLDKIFGGRLPGYVYSRYANPTTEALEETLALLDGGKGAIAFSSGMAALHGAFLSLGLSTGSRLLVSRDVYGATYTLLRSLLAPLGVKVEFLDLKGPRALETALRKKPAPKALFLEVLTNPLLHVIDVERVIRTCRRARVQVIVDNTFATPILCKPLELGAAMVLHSTTKYLGGHGDVTGGVVIAAELEQARALRTVRKIGGGTPSPFDSWLALRGVKTLALRMSRICQNALAVAVFLAQHPKVEHVRYPGLASHPQHDTARRLFGDRGGGGLVAFEIRRANKRAVMRFMDRLAVIHCAATLGDIYSQLLYPRISSHRDLGDQERAALGIGESLVRLSLGIEHPDDLIEDLATALG